MTAKLVPPEPPRPGAGSDSLWAGLRDAASAYAIATAALHWQRPLLLLAPDPQLADRWLYELQFFLAGRLPLLLFPDRETLPYDKLAPSADLLSERLQLFVELPKLQRGVVVAPLSAALHRTPPARHCADALHLEPGAKVDLTQLRDQLAACGYRFVQQVAERGEAAVRGSLIDVFPMGLAKQPCRIDLYDDRIEQMRWFDSETQLSAEQATSLDILPAAEVPLSTASLESFRIALRDFCEGDPMRSDVYRGVRQGHLPAGIEYYLPLFFADTSDLFAYLPQDTVLIHDSSLWTQAEDFYQDAEQRYQRLKKESEHEPILPPAQLFLDQEQLQSRSKGFARVLLQEQIDQSADFNLDAHRVPPVTVDARAPDPFAMLRRFIDRHKGYSVLLSCDSKGAMEAMLESLTPAQMKIHICTDFDDFVAGRHSLAAVPQSLDRGMLLAGEKIVVFAEPHIFGRKFRRRKQGKSRSAAQALRNLTELVIGSPVVHEDYGIGRYQGLEVITHNELDAEFILLHYADGDKLYVPVMLAHRIQRYSGTDPEHAPLHNLGGGQWQKSKARAAKQAHDTAAELLLLQAKRQSRTRPPFTMQPEQNVFRNSFRYTETTDQEQAIDAVLSDLQAATPMDRLIAGDAGFGKTEVAMHAAFAVISNNRQVAMLAPTTLLVQQHYRNFRDRFADWPVRVAQLSRFVETSAGTATVKGLQDGTVDIVIGTHALLHKKISYKRLGLIIIDEEHRFGVRQKEQVKALRAETDILSMTATPIPRTLDMALSGIRDISIISTPPARRQPVATQVRQWDPLQIHEAVERELRRGGQVFFVHNRIRTMDQAVQRLQAAVPNLEVRVAHGQMRERDLENIMVDFSHRRFSVLACTAIIENGIDIPTANTIIIDDSHKFGLAQLYQLRGRVGRSHHNAYAYLIAPPMNAINEDARQRLDAICAMDTLGIGLGLALQDLEIRGAGVLLGEEQSGHINSIGYGTYLDLVRRAVQELQQGGDIDPFARREVDIELPFAALLPEDYIPDVQQRLRIYRSLASIDQEQLPEWRMELVDRYGALPVQADSLLRQTAIRLKAEQLGVSRMKWDAKGGRITFNDNCKLETQRLMALLQNNEAYKLAGPNSIRINMAFTEAQQQHDFIMQFMTSIQQ